MTDLLPLVNAIVLAAGGIGGVLLWRAERRERTATAIKAESEAAAIIKTAAIDLLTPLQDKVERLEQTNARLETEVAELRNRVEQAIRDEVAYQAELHAKDQHIDELRRKLIAARQERDALAARVDDLEIHVRDHHDREQQQ